MMYQDPHDPQRQPWTPIPGPFRVDSPVFRGDCVLFRIPGHTSPVALISPDAELVAAVFEVLTDRPVNLQMVQPVCITQAPGVHKLKR